MGQIVSGVLNYRLSSDDISDNCIYYVGLLIGEISISGPGIFIDIFRLFIGTMSLNVSAGDSENGIAGDWENGIAGDSENDVEQMTRHLGCHLPHLH